MANITGFRIDTDVTFSFDTGGAVPPPSGGAVPANATLLADPAGTSVIGNATFEEV